jgi:hypothetical protein
MSQESEGKRRLPTQPLYNGASGGNAAPGVAPSNSGGADMPFCPGCGKQHADNDRFCANCGRPLTDGAEAVPSATAVSTSGSRTREPRPEETLWEGQPHGVLNPIETHSVSYVLTTERLRFIRGMLNRTFDEVELTRVRDVTVEQSLAQRALGIGNVRLATTDSSAPEILLHDIEEPQHVKELIRQAVREQRQRFGVRQLEDL